MKVESFICNFFSKLYNSEGLKKSENSPFSPLSTLNRLLYAQIYNFVTIERLYYTCRPIIYLFNLVNLFMVSV